MDVDSKSCNLTLEAESLTTRLLACQRGESMKESVKELVAGIVRNTAATFPLDSGADSSRSIVGPIITVVNRVSV